MKYDDEVDDDGNFEKIISSINFVKVLVLRQRWAWKRWKRFFSKFCFFFKFNVKVIYSNVCTERMVIIVDGRHHQNSTSFY